MRAYSRIALVLILVVLCPPLLMAEHLQGDCPLTRAWTTAPTATESFDSSTHGVFPYNNSVFTLRGGILTAYNVTSLGEMSLAKSQPIASLVARESKGGVAFANGILYLSGENGLEIWDLRNAATGAPALQARVPGWHFRRMAISGTTLAGLYPLTDMPCHPSITRIPCETKIELFNVSTLSAPTRVATISVPDTRAHWGFNDVVFARGFLILATEGGGIYSYNISNPSSPAYISSIPSPSLWLDASTSGNTVVAGDDYGFYVFTVGTTGTLSLRSIYTIPQYLTIERGNNIMFHRQTWIDESAGRIITMIDERDPQTLEPARTIAFDVIDIGVTQYEGNVERLYENVSMLSDDEVKWDPVAVGPYVYVVGDRTGIQSWGSCGEIAGTIDLDTIYQLPCGGGAEIHGWVTGRAKVASVELSIVSPAGVSSALPGASISPFARTDVSSKTPVFTWRVPVNFDDLASGEYTLRAVATDVLGNKRQFASRQLYFPGGGLNCTARRRATGR